MNHRHYQCELLERRRMSDRQFLSCLRQTLKADAEHTAASRARIYDSNELLLAIKKSHLQSDASPGYWGS